MSDYFLQYKSELRKYSFLLFSSLVSVSSDNNNRILLLVVCFVVFWGGGREAVKGGGADLHLN